MKNKQDSLYKAIGGVNEKFILEAETVTPVKQKKRLKAVFKVALAAAILSIAGAIAIAASPALQNLLNLPFVRENPKLTRVPDGYVGIYTAEDLDTIVSEIMKLPPGQLKKVLTPEVLAVLAKYGFTQ